MYVTHLNKEFLAEEYLEKKKAIKQIGRECDKSYTTIRYWLIKFNIPIRSRSEANEGRKKTKEHRKNISIGRKKLLKDKTKHSRWKGGPVEVVCERCGKKHLIAKYKHKKGIGRFCSKVCYTLY